MGYLLKEALKSLCGINQWSYAVFWKIGCQNPKLLIWDDCYYESVPCSALSHDSDIGHQGVSSEQMQGCGTQMAQRVQLLIDKMMADNQVQVVGEGLVGRTAFMGSHQWIVSGNYNGNIHPPEVLSEVHLQFSAGMQTVAIIPVSPHGVVQLGSTLAIMENIGFVHNVKGLFLQLGCIPSVLLSDNYPTNESDERLGMPVADPATLPMDPALVSRRMKSYSSMLGASDLQSNLNPGSKFSSQASHSGINMVSQNLHSNASGSHMSSVSQDVSRSDGYMYQTKNSSLVDGKGMLDNKSFSMEVITMQPDVLLTQQDSCSKDSTFSYVLPSGSSQLMEQSYDRHASSLEAINQTSGTLAGFVPHRPPNSSAGCSLPGKSIRVGGYNGLGTSNKAASCTVPYMMKNEVSLSNVVDQFNTNCILSGFSDNGYDRVPKKEENDLHEVHGLAYTKSKDRTHLSDFVHGPFSKFHDASQVSNAKDAQSGVIFPQSSTGEDLFDVLGVDFKKKLLNVHERNAVEREEQRAFTNNQNKISGKLVDLQDKGSSYYSNCQGITQSAIFSESGSGSGSGSDHLLDAVVSGIPSVSRQTSDDNVSCHTTVTNISSSSIPSKSGNSGGIGKSNNMQQEFYGLSRPAVGFSGAGVISSRPGCGKNDTESCSQGSSFYGSNVSSWMEQCPRVKCENSVSTANSKKGHDAGKARKRLKPGENPRPRPKDRQMIQDRVKELREIVPNGAKCSIDALLERTIKHMLFLQSVNKHADKLRDTMTSKVIDKDGLLLKDNFEGGATWAFEVGSQSMVCPIIVEDLNPPRQLLVEILCEERGFFLEIADIIRGLGLTILKGIMKSRNDKIWARFAVEANRDITRMEIFISLVHLLEQTVKGSAGSGSGENNDNMVVNSTFHQTTSSAIPAKENMVGPLACTDAPAL